MKFYTCGYRFDYYGCLLYGRESQRFFFLMVNRYRKHNVGHTFRLCNQYVFVPICYTCLFSLLKVKKLDADNVDNNLRKVWEF